MTVRGPQPYTLPPFDPTPPGLNLSHEEWSARIDAHLAEHFPHLTSLAARALYDSVEERLSFLEKLPFVPCSRYTPVLAFLEDLLERPGDFVAYQFGHDRRRHPGLFLLSASGNGKTSLLRHFLSRNRVHTTDSGVEAPVVLFRAPEHCTASLLLTSILDSLRIAHSLKATIASKELLLYKTLSYLRTRMLIVDDFDYVARSLPGSPALDLLFSIAEHLHLALAFAGTSAAYQHFADEIHGAPARAINFKVFELAPWDFGDQYLAFLSAYERTLPFPLASNLTELPTATLIHTLAGPRLGATIALLKATARAAIQQELPNLSDSLLKRVSITIPHHYPGSLETVP